MDTNSGKKFIVSVISLGTAFIVGSLVSFLLAPFITENIGTEAYGYIALSKSFVSYASVLSIAVTSFAARFISVEYHKNSIDKASEYFYTTIISNTILSLVVIAVVGIFILNIDSIIKVNPLLKKDVQLLFFFAFLNFGIVNIGSAFSASAYIVNRLDIVGIVNALAALAEAIFLYMVFSVVKPRVFYLGLAMMLIGSVQLLGNLIITKKYVPDILAKKARFSFKAFRNLVAGGIWNSFNSLGNILNSGLDLLMCNAMLTELAMGQVAIVKTIQNIFYKVIQLISQPLQPVYLKLYAEDKNDELIEKLLFLMKITGFLSNIFFAIIFTSGKLIYKLWLPSQDAVLLQRLTILNCISLVLEGYIIPLYYIYTITIKNKLPCIITIFGGLFNVTGMYILIKYTSLGIYSIVLTTTIVMGFISLVTNPLYMAYCMKVKWHTFYPTIIKNIISCGIMCIICRLLFTVIVINGWAELILFCISCIVVSMIIHALICFSISDLKAISNQIVKSIRTK